jgi:hypothetical protein
LWGSRLGGGSYTARDSIEHAPASVNDRGLLADVVLGISGKDVNHLFKLRPDGWI